MCEHCWRQRLHVVRYGEISSLEDCPCLRRPVEGERRPRARPERGSVIGASGPHQLEQIGTDVIAHEDALPAPL